MNYYEIPSLSCIYLEDSYVLSVGESEDSLVFELDAVLTEEHPKYEPPLRGEKYCYKKIWISLLNAESLSWYEKRLNRISDASSNFDYGNIDNFSISEGCYELMGDWGHVVVRGKNLGLIVLD